MRTAGAPRDDPTIEPLLSSGFLGRLERMQQGTRRRLAGHLAGEHRSPRHGSSLDFADSRPYTPGDDFRRIDYHLWARLDVLALKLYFADEDLQVRLLVDTSGSMAVGGKLRQATRVAAAVGYLALVRRDPVTVHTVPLDGVAARFAGHAAAPALFRHLSQLRASGPTPFAMAAARLLSRPGPPGLTVVISDFLTPEWDAALSRLPARGSEVVAVHVIDPSDLSPTLVGDLELVDRETGDRVAVTLTPAAVRRYEERARAWADRIDARCRQIGAAAWRLRTDEDVEDLLVGAWQRAGLLR